ECGGGVRWRRQRWWVGRGNGSGGGVVMMEMEMEDDDGGEGEVVEVIITAAEPRLGSRSEVDLHICIFLGWRSAAATVAGGWPEIGGGARS
ncbi:hypothetical protein Tco_0023935, partial [Tanacetum coccineum]